MCFKVNCCFFQFALKCCLENQGSSGGDWWAMRQARSRDRLDSWDGFSHSPELIPSFKRQDWVEGKRDAKRERMNKGEREREFQRLGDRLWYSSHHSDDEGERQETGQNQSLLIVKTFKIPKAACWICACLGILKTGQGPAAFSLPFCCCWFYFANGMFEVILWTIA